MRAFGVYRLAHRRPLLPEGFSPALLRRLLRLRLLRREGRLGVDLPLRARAALDRANGARRACAFTSAGHGGRGEGSLCVRRHSWSVWAEGGAAYADHHHPRWWCSVCSSRWRSASPTLPRANHAPAQEHDVRASAGPRPVLPSGGVEPAAGEMVTQRSSLGAPSPKQGPGGPSSYCKRRLARCAGALLFIWRPPARLRSLLAGFLLVGRSPIESLGRQCP